MTEKLFSLKNDRLSAEISTHGAELRSLRDDTGHEYLWCGDPAVWERTAPVLFPICGGLLNKQYVHDGKTYTLANHGFGQHLPYEVAASSQTSLTLVLRDSPETRAVYPFSFAFFVTFTLEGASLVITYRTENTGTVPLYYADGAHESYACPGGIQDYDVVFDEPETLYRTVLDGCYLAKETELVPTNGRVLAMSYHHMDNDSLYFGHLNSHGASLLHRATGRGVHVAFADFKHFLLWTKQGAPYLCLEPWNGSPDAVDSDGILAHKDSMFTLAPGESRQNVHTITPIKG